MAKKHVRESGGHEHTQPAPLKDALAAVVVTPGERSTVIIEGEIPYEELAAHRTAALRQLGKDIVIDGFRKGHIPEKILVEQVGEMALLTEMAERALSALYPDILKAHTIDAIGYPKISITKLAPHNPLGFKAVVATVPEVQLPDYKTIARHKNAVKGSGEVTEQDLSEAIEKIQRQKLAYDRIQEKARKKAAAEKAGQTLPTPDTVSDTEEDPGTLPLPELTDDYVKKLGDFEDVANFRSKIRTELEKEKGREAVMKHRSALTDAIAEETTVVIPDILIDAELDQMFAQMESDLARAKLSLDDYLAHIKKTRDDLKKDWSPAAEKRARLQLILNRIAREEKLEPDQEKVAHEVAHLLGHYKDADPARVRIYVESMLRNEKVMALLESQ